MNQKYYIYNSILISIFFGMNLIACISSAEINQSNIPDEKIPRLIEKKTAKNQMIISKKSNGGKFKIF